MVDGIHRKISGMHSSRYRIGGWFVSLRRLFGEVQAVWKACFVVVAVAPVSVAEAVVWVRN